MAMIDEIREPLALASVRWVPPTQGGRSSGSPTARVYAATAVFRLGNDEELVPGWPATADHISILLQKVGTLPTGEDLSRVGFLAPDLARPYVKTGAELVILEGPKVVANAIVREIFE